MHYQYVVVGAGLAGLTVAERIASQLDKKVLVIEKRNHIAGNAYDSYNDDGILVHDYGPHIFHTNDKTVYDYLGDFTEWNDYFHRVLSFVDGNLVPLPISAETINRLYNMNLSCEEVEEFLKKKSIDIPEIKTSRDIALSKIGMDLYQKFFENYTKKQWGLDPGEIDTSVISRIPVRYNRDTRYFTDRYQGMPRHGYTRMCAAMAAHKNIKLLLNTDYKEVIADISYDTLVYTGPTDYFYDYRHGELRYRSIRFAFETLDREKYQEAPVVNYPNDNDYTRITEFKQLTGQAHAKTTIMKEYPCDGGDPYYPLPTADCKARFALYEAEMAKETNVYFLGRLAQYRYYNMDAAVAEALRLFEKIVRS